jgi:hypothetical protein
LTIKKGSGVYVRARATEGSIEGNLPLDRLISFFLGIGLDKGQSVREIQARLKRWLSLPPPDQFLVVEPDTELRRIIVREIQEATGARVLGIGPEECSHAGLPAGAAAIAMLRHAELVRSSLPRDTYVITLRSRSVAESLLGEKTPPVDALIAIVSCWPEFLRWTHTILVAAGIDPNALSLRDAREPGWEKGLRSATFVITDSLMSPRLPADCKARVFRVVSDTSIAELRAYVEEFFRTNP